MRYYCTQSHHGADSDLKDGWREIEGLYLKEKLSTHYANVPPQVWENERYGNI